MNHLCLDVIERTEDFALMRDEWTALLEDSATDNLFLTWEWMHTWWKHLGRSRQLAIVTVRAGGRLVAIAPLARCPRRPTALRFIPALELLGSGDVGSDYLDVIVRRGAEGVVAQALVDELGVRGLLLRLPQLDGRSMAATIAGRLQRRGWRLRVARSDVCPFIPLAGRTFDSYLATLGSSHRYNFRRRLRRLEGEFRMRFTCVESDADRRQALDSLVGLHNERWTRRGGSTAFHSPALIAFHDEISRIALTRGWLRLFLLHLDDRPAAALYGFSYRGKFYFYQSGFDSEFSKHSVGLVAMGLTIASAIDEGLSEYDLLHGDERYKFLWARTSRALTGIELYPPSPLGALSRAATGFYRAARSVAGRVARPATSRTHVEPDLVVPSSR